MDERTPQGPPDELPPFLRPDYRSMDLEADGGAQPPPDPPRSPDEARIDARSALDHYHHVGRHHAHENAAGEYVEGVGRVSRPGNPPGFLSRVLAPLGVVGILLLKFGKVALVLLKAVPFLGKLGWLFASFGSYAVLYGWKFGLAVIASLFLHELGHWVQLKREGVQPSGMAFVPFMGAYVSYAPGSLRTAAADFRVSIAGPVAGSLAGLAAFVVYQDTGSQFWLAVASMNFFLNLVNLVPLWILDGRHIVQTLPGGPLLVLAVIGGAVCVVAGVDIYLLAFSILLALTWASRTFMGGRHNRYPEATDDGSFAVMAAAYGVLIGALVAALAVVHPHLPG
jgi:Zn-dependent protease